MEPQKQQLSTGKVDGQALLAAWRQERESALTREQQQHYGAMLRQERRERLAHTQAFEGQKPTLIDREALRLSRAGAAKMSAQERRQEAARLVETRHQAQLAEDGRDWQTLRDGYLCTLEAQHAPQRPDHARLTAVRERQIAALSAGERQRFEALQSRLMQEGNARIEEHMAAKEALMAQHTSRRFERLLPLHKAMGATVDPRMEQKAERVAGAWAREVVEARLAVLQKQQSLEWRAQIDGFLRHAEHDRQTRPAPAQTVTRDPAATDAVAIAMAKARQQEEERERAGQAQGHGRE
jgi:hypothetical protein